MSDIDNTQKTIDDYETKKQYYDNLRDEVSHLEKSINDLKANIKNTQHMQDRMKQNNYEIWQQLEDKTTQTKTIDKEPSIDDILDGLK